MADGTTQKPRLRNLKITSAPADHPLYSTGLVLGGRRLKRSTSSSKSGQRPSSKDPIQEQLEEEMSESVPHQFGKTDE